MKKVMMVLAFASGMALMAETETVGGYTWTYRINGDEAVIYGDYVEEHSYMDDDYWWWQGDVVVSMNNSWYEGATYACTPAISPLPIGTVAVPQVLGGKPVRCIDKGAFYECSGLTDVYIPESVTNISDGAFYGCDGLRSMTLPCTAIGSAKSFTLSGPYNSTYRRSGGLETMFVRHSRITDRCFLEFGVESSYERDIVDGDVPPTLTDVVIIDAQDGVSIASGAFEDCGSLTHVTIPSGVANVGNYAFQNCSGLTSMVIPNSVTSIGSYAFYGCSGLSSVTFEGNAPYVSSDAFQAVNTDCTVYVKKDSTGWGVDIPGLWNGMKIVYADEELAMPTDGLVAYYPFDGNANDASGNKNHGAANGAMLTTGKDGNANGAYFFDGEDDYIRIPNSVSLNITEVITMAAWVKLASSDSVLSICDKGGESWRFEIYQDDGEAEIGADQTFIYFDHKFPVGEWCHVAATYDGSVVRLFLNGIQIGQADRNFGFAPSSADVYVGNDPFVACEYFHGVMDELRIYNRALSAAEVKALYDGSAVTPTMVPGFYRVRISCSDFDSTTSIWNSPDKTVTLYPSELYATECPEYTMYAFASYMWMEGGVTYNFRAGYDDRSTIVVNGETVCVLEGNWGYFGYDCQENEGSYTPTVSGWYPVELRAWNRAGEGGATTDEYHPVSGFWYNSSVDSMWRKFEDAGDGARFRAVVGDGGDIRSFTVTFDLNGADGSAPAPREVAYGSTLGSLPTPTRDGYTFLGWYTSPYDWEGWQVDEWTEVYGDATYYARWEQLSYSVTFDANGGTGDNVYTYYYGDGLGSLPTPTREGYEFLGWYTAKSGGSQADYYTPVYGDAIYYAQWRINSYTVTFNANGGSVGTSSMTRNYGVSLGSLPTPSRTGHTFLGWYTSASGGSRVYESDAVTANVTFYAHWQANTYTVTFNANGGYSSCSYSRTYGSQVGTLPTASRSGYVFKGWFTAASGGTQVSASTTVTGNATYYAHWATHAEELAATLGTANVEFATDSNAAWFPDGSAVRSGYISHNGSSTMSVRLYGSGLLSFRWRVSSEPEYDMLTYSIDGIQGGRISGEQGWAAASILVAGAGWHTVRFTYAKDGGSTYGSDCGWVDSLVWTGSAPPVTNFTISFNANGGTVGTARITRSRGSTLGALPVPSRGGYTFLGWFTAASGGVQVYASTTVSANATYYAHWQANSSGGGSGGGATPHSATCTVSFDGNGGSVDTPRVTRTTGAAIGSMPTPEAEGYEFVGWFTAKTGGTQVSASTKVTANVTYYAHWQAVADENTLWDEDEAFDADAAAVFDGFLTKDGEVKGLIQVKAGKAKKKTGVAQLKASVTLLGQSAKLSYKGAFGKPGATDEDFAPGAATLKCAGHPDLELRLGRHALWGEMGGYDIEGARNVFAKSGDPKAAALSKWQGTYTLALETVDASGSGLALARGYSGLSVTVGAKGKVKVKGTMVDGAKVSVSSQLLVGDERCCIPVVVPLYSKRGGFGLNLWLQDDGSIEVGEISAWDATASGAPFKAWFGEDVPVARTGAAFPETMSFMLADDPEIDGEELLYDFLPWEVVFRSAGWALPAAGSIKYSAEAEEFVDVKESENPAGLKLKYVSKMGSFKGSFNMYGVNAAGKLVKHKANVSGVMVGRKGYGTATLKGVGSWAVVIE